MAWPIWRIKMASRLHVCWCCCLLSPEFSGERNTGTLFSLYVDLFGCNGAKSLPVLYSSGNMEFHGISNIIKFPRHLRQLSTFQRSVIAVEFNFMEQRPKIQNVQVDSNSARCTGQSANRGCTNRDACCCVIQALKVKTSTSWSALPDWWNARVYLARTNQRMTPLYLLISQVN